MTGFAPDSASPALFLPKAEIAPLAALIEAAAPRDPALQGFVRALIGEPGGLGLADCFRAMRALAQVEGQETLELASRPMVAGTAELVLSRAVACATVGEATREIAHAYNILHGAAYNRVELRGRRFSYVLDDEHFIYTRARDAYLHFSLECALIFLHAAISELAGQNLDRLVRSVTTRRPPTADDPPATLAFWGVPVTRGGDFYGLVYDASVASLPMTWRRRAVSPDLAVHNRIISMIEASQTGMDRREPFAHAVRRAFHDGLNDQNEIAVRLGVSVATLRRRLVEEGVVFRDLRHQLLSEQAQRMLGETRDVGAVAERLGFSDTRSFTRAFKGWIGLTPTNFLSRLAIEA